MPRAFDITATTSDVKLNASGQGEVSFTISNKLGTGVSARATVEPSGNARAEWMSFPNGMERTLSPDGTAVIPVRISVPPGTPPGSYGFGLVVTDVANPDEHYDRGPSVAFTVAAVPVPVKKPFPWWIVALAAGVVVIVGVVVAILSSHGGTKPGLGAACEKKAPKCDKGLTCGPANTCLGDKGFTGCQKPEQCVTGRCEGGACQEQVSLGDTCDSNDDCRSPLTCSSGLCLIPLGQKCTQSAQCASGNCAAQACAPSVVQCPPCPIGTFCVNGACVRRQIFVDPRLMQELQVQPQRVTPSP